MFFRSSGGLVSARRRLYFQYRLTRHPAQSAGTYVGDQQTFDDHNLGLWEHRTQQTNAIGRRWVPVFFINAEQNNYRPVSWNLDMLQLVERDRRQYYFIGRFAARGHCVAFTTRVFGRPCLKTQHEGAEACNEVVERRESSKADASRMAANPLSARERQILIWLAADNRTR